MIFAKASIAICLIAFPAAQSDPTHPVPAPQKPQAGPAGPTGGNKAGGAGGKGGKKAMTPEEKEAEREAAKKEAEKIKAERFKLPIVEVISAPEKAVDSQKVFDEVMTQMGAKAFASMQSVSFRRETVEWRDGKYSAYDSAETVAKPSLPIAGRTQITSNYDEHDRLVRFFAVVNGDDRFEQRELTVLSTEKNEKNATDTIAYETFMPLAPFILAQANVHPTYVGKSSMKTFTPKSFDKDKGWIDYAPTNAEYDVLRFEVPAPYSAIAGPTVELYVDPSTRKVAMLATQDRRHEEYFAGERLFVEYFETATINGVVLPTKMRTSLAFDAYRLESTDILNHVLDKPIDPKLLKRP